MQKDSKIISEKHQIIRTFLLKSFWWKSWENYFISNANQVEFASKKPPNQRQLKRNLEKNHQKKRKKKKHLLPETENRKPFTTKINLSTKRADGGGMRLKLNWNFSIRNEFVWEFSTIISESRRAELSTDSTYET